MKSHLEITHSACRERSAQNVVLCSQHGDLAEPALVEACQRLRYRIYRGELGLDTPDMDHQRAIDVEARDPFCRFLVAKDDHGEVLGCVRMQSARPPSFYAEDEFVLQDPWWREQQLVEGARFVVAPAARAQQISLLLFQAFRDLARREGRSTLLSVAIVPAADASRAQLAALTHYVQTRVALHTERACPAPGYELEPSTPAELAAHAETPVTIPPMLRLLATRRTTLCSPPAYCRRFRTFNFLLATQL